MIDEILNLRNSIHGDKFRFKLTPSLWESLYVSEKELEESKNFVRVMKNGRLRGYAVYNLLIDDHVKVCRVLEICADKRDILIELIDGIIKNCIKEEVDLIFLRRCEEPYDDVFDKRGFLTSESAIMAVLLNPRELLLTFSEEINHGKILKLVIKGFDPIIVKVGKKGIRVGKGEKPDLKVLTDSKTFLELFFGKTSVLKEFLKGKMTIDKIFSLSTVFHFFNLIKQRGWYIPYGDWT